MLLALKADELKIVDDQGKAVDAAGQRGGEQTSSSAPRTRAAEMNLNLIAPERAAKVARVAQGQGRRSPSPPG